MGVGIASSVSVISSGPWFCPEYDVSIPPLMSEFLMVTQGVDGLWVPLPAVMSRPELTIFESITTPHELMVLGPV